MTRLTLLSGGAAQGLVGALAPAFEAETGCRIEGEFGAVGAMAAKLRAGAPADLLILTAALIAELTREGRVVEGSAADVGTVLTAVAVRPATRRRRFPTARRCGQRFLAPTRSISPIRGRRRPASISPRCSTGSASARRSRRACSRFRTAPRRCARSPRREARVRSAAPR